MVYRISIASKITVIHNPFYISVSVRDGKNLDLNPQAWIDALLDPESGVTHTNLTGARAQNVDDAVAICATHRLADYFGDIQRHPGRDYSAEERFVRVHAQWNEACDAR